MKKHSEFFEGFVTIEFTQVHIEDLEIVPLELWLRVKERQEVITATYGKTKTNPLNATQRPKYLLSRRLECAECGGTYAVMAKERYGCSKHKNKLGCDNERTISRKDLEQRVLKAFPNSMFSTTNLRDRDCQLVDVARLW
ncbi:hypothetical protein LP7551_04454 [Roseibium album]|nr:hypothetical protein LP7551_04454 [Roseibium album]